MGFFVADESLGLSFIHEVMDFFGQAIAIASVEFFLDQRPDVSEKPLF